MKKIAIVILLLATIVGCKTIESSENQKKTYELLKQSNNNNVFIRARIKPSFPDMNQSFTANITIHGLDSMSVQVFGPFGISIGRLYSDKDEFIFYNTFENNIVKGTPSSDNLKKVSGLELNFEDLVRILRLSAPSEINGFNLKEDLDKDGKLLFYKNESYPEFILFSSISSQILQYQRKNLNNENLMNINFSQFQDFEIGKKPSETIIELPQSNGSITINISEYKQDDTGERLSFPYPDNIKVVNLDK
jgi:hypothetical protein